MRAIVFLLNLPWTVLGLLLAVISLPRGVKIHSKPYALIFTVRSFWWQTWLPGYKGVRASTMGHVILLGAALLPGDQEHELVHVAQYVREPFVYPFMYAYQTRKYGYKNNQYEVEAYSKAGNLYVEAEVKDIQNAKQSLSPLVKAIFVIILIASVYHFMRDLLQLFGLDSAFTDIAHRPHVWCGQYCDIVTIPFDIISIVISTIVLQRKRVGVLGIILLATLPLWLFFTLLP